MLVMPSVYFHSTHSHQATLIAHSLRSLSQSHPYSHLAIHNIRIINVSCLAVIRALLLSHGMLGVFGEFAISET